MSEFDLGTQSKLVKLANLVHLEGSVRRSSWKVVAATLLILGSSLIGCRVVVPSPEEQQDLAARGAFAGQRPGWLSTDVRSADSPVNLIPEQFGSRPEIQGQLASDELIQAERKALADQYAEKRVETAESDENLSPLDRINSACPGMEAEVNDALTTATIGDRIAKYSALTARCGASSDLWIWLGNDYLKSGELPAAKRSFDQALVIDPGNVEARRGNDEVARLLSVQD